MTEISESTYLVLGIIAGRGSPISFNEIGFVVEQAARAADIITCVTDYDAIRGEIGLLLKTHMIAIAHVRRDYLPDSVGYMLAKKWV